MLVDEQIQNTPVIIGEIQPTPTPTDVLFGQLVEATLSTVATSSARLYRQTFRTWQAWCHRQGISPLEINASTVKQFLLQKPVSKATRQWELAALRKLARVLALDYTNPARRASYESLLLLRVPTEGTTNRERPTRALSPAQADKVLRVWDEDKPIHLRNRALIAVLFLAGLRRSEAAVLRWEDIDLQEGVIHVRHGKGDVARDAALAGDYALEALSAWHTRGQGSESRGYVFCSVAKGGKLGSDAPMTSQAVYNVVKTTEQRADVPFSPHDARRTFITEALATGAALADVQAQAGHKQESTTLRYAKPVDARHRRQKLRLRYGG
jgi:integrase